MGQCHRGRSRQRQTKVSVLSRPSQVRTCSSIPRTSKAQATKDYGRGKRCRTPRDVDRRGRERRTSDRSKSDTFETTKKPTILVGFFRWLTPMARPYLCHCLALPSLCLTSRTIWSIWNGCKRLGSFANVARHFAKTVSGLFCFCLHSSMIFWIVSSHSSRRIGDASLIRY